MAGNNIYVQGSYIDVHDNENVYLSVDKAQVKMQQKNQTVGDRHPSEDKLPEILMSEEAVKYWQRLQEAGFVDADYRLMSETTRKQAMYIAMVFAEKLRMTATWKPFEQLWGKSNLAQEKWDFQQTGVLPSRSKEIDEIFRD